MHITTRKGRGARRDGANHGRLRVSADSQASGRSFQRLAIRELARNGGVKVADFPHVGSILGLISTFIAIGGLHVA